MTEINIIELNSSTFQVTVIAQASTTHTITVQVDYARKLTAGKITVEQLLRKSFEFLLQHESNTSILRSFDLSVIARYFPEYELEIST